MFKGYLHRPNETAATLRSGWLHTGDIGKVDADGYLTFLGRFKEMIKVSGYSVFPEQVEAILNLHFAISYSAVIGIEHAVKGEAIEAFVVAEPGQVVDPEELIAWARANMAAYKVPVEIRIVASLPKSPSGKVLRRLLKSKAAKL